MIPVKILISTFYMKTSKNKTKRKINKKQREYIKRKNIIVVMEC